MHKVNIDPSSLRLFRKYFDEFMRLNCARDLLDLKLFPDSKEITESFGAYNAVRKHLRNELQFNDPSVACVVVGDGNTPRTAALFAFRSAWNVISIDPRMKREWTCGQSKVERLSCFSVKVEEQYLVCPEKVLIVAVHSHAPLPVCLEYIKGDVRYIVANPCCVKMEIDKQPDIQYEDMSILSPQNMVKVWKNV